MPLNNDREIATKGYWYINSYKVKADQVIYKGAFVNIDSNGYLKIASDTVGERFAGISTDRVNTIGIADGSYTCNVGYIKQIAIYQTGFTQANILDQVYAISDSALSLTATNINPCGRIVAVDLERNYVTVHIVIDPASTLITGDLVVQDGASIIFNGEMQISNPLTPPALTANTNNWNIVGMDDVNIVRVSSTSGVELTGIVSPNPVRGKILHFFNVGSNEILLKNSSANSIAANRFLLQKDIAVKSNEAIVLVYDPVDNRWRATGTIAQV